MTAKRPTKGEFKLQDMVTDLEAAACERNREIYTLRAQLTASQSRCERLEAALRMIASGTEDTEYPFRSAPDSVLRRMARDALATRSGGGDDAETAG